MIFNTLISTVTASNIIEKKASSRNSRNKYIMQKYQERSITNRYFR